ncbi:V-type ATP synthase subunit E [Lutispora thermophila]|uniref:V-type proton ATPase subunit E n=1 Tax=Lutispora thermophila DSM 19022 TaxID=1122184 RepID=A0A1M6CMQ6_9FIRM|nr:V-type ATP synthase subunit E [Lutispora thermophila]SHI61988.1 V/A-type H+-transporting ATPase subunit E [Lutispora thermophila DSM 19022]
MSNLENLINKIIEDAKKEADKISQESAKVRQDILNSRINEANEIRKKILEKAENEAAMIKDRIISNAELKVRDEKLKAKQHTIDRVFELSKDRLKELSGEEYVKFLTNNLKSLNLKGTEVLIIPEKMKEKVKAIASLPKISNDETVDSGFILKDNDVEINFSFDSLVDYLREELESEIAKHLFKE